MRFLPNISRAFPLRPMLACCALLAGAFELGASSRPGGGYLTFQLDNDLFFNTDNNYTNGARLTWISELRSQSDLNDAQKWLEKLSGDENSLHIFQNLTGFDDPSKIEYRFGFSLTQLMFTPTSLTAPEAPPGERPYAGWLGIGFSLHVQDPHALNMVEFSIGTIGPNSLAHPTQDFIHDLRGFDKFQGWDSQFGNEITGNLFFTQVRRLHVDIDKAGWSLDGFWEWGFSLGTFRTDAIGGAMVRGGWNLPIDFSDPRLSLRSYSHQMAGAREVNRYKDISLYGLAGFRGYAVAHDSTLDGSLFHSEPRAVNSEPLVGEAYLGAGVRLWRTEISYSNSYRTKEFEGQAKPQRYGSVTIRIHF